jgi:hypothetical protein
MGAICRYETSEKFYKITRRSIPEDSRRHNGRSQNVKSFIVRTVRSHLREYRVQNLLHKRSFHRFPAAGFTQGTQNTRTAV